MVRNRQKPVHNCLKLYKSEKKTVKNSQIPIRIRMLLYFSIFLKFFTVNYCLKNQKPVENLVKRKKNITLKLFYLELKVEAVFLQF